jgi:hypothetical protein
MCAHARVTVCPPQQHSSTVRTAPARATTHAAARPRGPKPAENTALIFWLAPVIVRTEYR